MLPFYIPDFEVNLKIGKMISLLSQLSFNRNETPVLTLEKIALFEFLSKHPYLLNKILYQKDKQMVEFIRSEIYSIEARFPNRKKLYDLKEIKKILNILIVYGFADVKLKNGIDVYYQVTEEGKVYAEMLKSAFFERMSDIFLSMKPLQSQTFSNTNSLIEYFIKDGSKN